MAEESQDWADGFLVVGNHPLLDLLNTAPVIEGETQNLLPDPAALVRWLRVERLAVADGTDPQMERWSRTSEARTFLDELVSFRERLRDAVLRLEGGDTPSEDFLADLNARLFAHPMRQTLVAEHGQLTVRPAFGTSISDTLWASLLDKAVQLFSAVQADRLRKCEGCAVHFHDVSKKGSRRWCSMSLCGNRIKVAAYQQRKRSSKLESSATVE
jgi:predicted RNA-binding Zn ribbon-like protein